MTKSGHIGLIRGWFAALAVATSLLLGWAPAALADDDAELAWKYHCVTCHGDTGIANSDRYPNLAGQNVGYLVSRLNYFREGKEAGNQMNAQAVLLSDEEIQRLAEYFSRQVN
ncbi:MAG: cytochrome c [Pseudomonadota bacterium]|jgi:cytochrome c553|nr:cytochrome c [Pseudomonadota bacterium]MEC7137437.1 cytochrome c [Pseudomonadota bacterium]MEC7250218.1 cytochrome c [Pseudomonadota bacterium]MEC7412636.1 cytochrome c [Pseudomonadota bacterium]MEC7418852.1 cytochrome c [Pseudomonadota bacterium]|tara:strand:+ start:3439 stop:3777 length:339 start_codon:yes stop_codon:yes gene_type:complete